MSDEAKCPDCGAEMYTGRGTVWVSLHRQGGPSCLRRQLAAVTAERDSLRAVVSIRRRPRATMSDEAKCPQCGLPRPPERGHLARGYERYCWRTDGDECFRRQLAQRDATIAKLKAVVDRLPRDTHGEPITLGARVTYKGEPQTICFVGSEAVALQGETVEWWVDAADCELAKETT